MLTRRNLLGAAALAGGAAAFGNLKSLTATAMADRVADGGVGMTPLNAPPLDPGVAGRDYTPVHTLNGQTLESKIVGGVKVMHLVAEEIDHEFVPGLRARCWGYNGQTPGPTIEAVARDRLRIYVTNRLPAPTTVHWHGIRIISGMDGVNGLTQPTIPVGQTYMYEFTVPDAGTFMYHPHFDEMTQQGMGLMGMFVVHPRQKSANPPDRDYAIMLSEWRIDPGTSRPVTTEMTDFNIFTMNSKVFPSTEPVVAQIGQRVRLRFGNLGAMDHHPIHLHGMQMTQVETDGGEIPESARYAMNTVLVPVGSTRAVEFIADNPGDWPMHCHMTHHTMNQMGHPPTNMLGFNDNGFDDKVDRLIPTYMTMGTNGMGDMASMRMAAPANSVPMLGAQAQFGVIDMGGMFTVVKIREKINGFEDPGDYAFPRGTVVAEATADSLRRDGIDPNVRYTNLK